MLKEAQKVIAKVIGFNRRSLVVEIGGITVNVPLEDLSYEWIDELSDKYKVGQELVVRVVELNRKEKHVRVIKRCYLTHGPIVL
ncbi:S1 RNA-binding domain-containing protein [Ammoniphilus sp. CFH 90114]|uniref:S1 RNA-binding domain-containing protein n=1 Tax=Ammoniphilus sp. CFH 90114 TaxID=2493665 RepID=UPI00100E1ADD|nr:S1 RNA-binding domain-containing protein [Ammoniphilus sp. CFH 90114]RXT05304.1 S1 RNA-binding domain-containing protein [Ammoniphilus sp. CFH 90114]